MLIDYAGAVGRCAIERVAKLGDEYRLQPKIDGTYVRVHLDGRGAVARVFSRRADITHHTALRGLIGQTIGAPFAELAGEAEIWTESANRLSAIRGHRLLHLFDCLHDGCSHLARMPYSERIDALWKMQARIDKPLPWRIDGDGNAHSKATGKFCAATPTDYRLAPIMPSVPVSQFETAWADWVAANGGEGLVAVNMRAKIGARRAKLKIKITDTLDAVVLATDSRRAYCSWAGGKFSVGLGSTMLSPGQCVEIAHNGFYETVAMPKFPRIVRVRHDKMAASGDAVQH